MAHLMKCKYSFAEEDRPIILSMSWNDLDCEKAVLLF